MAKQILQRYGTAAQLAGTAGTNREIALEVDGSGIATGQIRVMDGVTNGGIVIAPAVGTVSESGGVPTGAIIERGSNANGDYVKFADGTIFQWHSITQTLNITGRVGSNYYYGGATWVLPVQMVSGTATAIGRVSGYYSAIGHNSDGNSITTSFSYVHLTLISLSDRSTSIYLQASGRWY